LYRNAPDTPVNPFISKSGYDPLSSGNSTLEDLIQALKQILAAMTNTPIPLSVNLSREEWAAVRQQKRHSKEIQPIIINKSHKGGEVVVSDLDHYITKGLAHLTLEHL
jgi:hypothetical protein